MVVLTDHPRCLCADFVLQTAKMDLVVPTSSGARYQVRTTHVSALGDLTARGWGGARFGWFGAWEFADKWE